MELFTDLVGGTSALLTRFSIIDGSGSSLRVRADPAMRKVYTDYFADKNPLHKVPDVDEYRRTWGLSILTDEDWMPKETLLRSEFYNDFLKPQNMYSHLMIRLGLVGEELCVLNIQRPMAKGQFSRQDLEVAAYFHQDLVRAFNLSRKLVARKEFEGRLGDLFHRSTHALFVLDHRARILNLNAAAERSLASRCGLNVVAGRLVATTSVEACRRLEAIVAGAASTEADLRSGASMAVSRPERAKPLSLTVVPLRTAEDEVFRGDGAVLLCATELDAEIELPEQKLRDLFGLTKAEVRLALALFKGARTAEAAETLGISANTASVHLGRIFEKAGVNRQAALIALIARAVGSELV
ncbi:MAG TPA: LuxR C-terminal-related transcriptional regulator [Caulobacteraceae bacterium]